MISAAKIKQLKQITGVGIADCKHALTQANGDYNLAIDMLRKQGYKPYVTSVNTTVENGVAIALVNNDKTKGVILALSAETNFIARNIKFIDFATKIARTALEQSVSTIDELLQTKINNTCISDLIEEKTAMINERIEIIVFEVLQAPQVIKYVHPDFKTAVLVGLNKTQDNYWQVGKDLAMHIAVMKPIAVDKHNVPQEIIEKEKEIATTQVINENKPQHILDKIVEGKLNKFLTDNTLLNQVYVKTQEQTVGYLLNTIDNQLKVTDFKHFKLL